MLTLLQINNTVNDKIEEALAGTEFSEVPMVASDVSKLVIRPSIKVMLEDSTNGLFNSQCREKTLTFRVYFFAKDRYKYKIDNAKMQDLLENAFIDDLYIGETYIPIESVNSEVTDTVLVVSFDLYLVELLPDTDIGELVEELQFKEEI